MRSLLEGRALPVVLLLVALVVTNGLATVTVFAHGLAFTAGPFGALLQVPIVAALGAAAWAILVRGKKLPREKTGLVPSAAAGVELVLGALAGIAAVALLVAVLAGVGAVSVAVSPSARALTALVALVALVVNAALQDVGLVSLALAASREGTPAPLPVVLALGLFVATHAGESASPIYLLAVAAFGAGLLALFFRAEPPSLGAVVGVHGGWNAAFFLLGGVRDPDAHALALVSLEPRDTLLSGGEAGLESGAANLVLSGVLAAAVAVGGMRARRSAPH